MSKELTEKWKNGELETGSYYVRYVRNGYTFQHFYYKNDGTLFYEVLAPVPTYEEYLALESDSLAKKEAEEEVAELEAEMMKRLRKVKINDSNSERNSKSD